jgi:hypothetical protein
MDERDFFDEAESLKPATLNCSHCRQTDTYEVRWLVRTKKKSLPGGADEIDRARFAKAQSYMLRRDDMVLCKNPRCRKRFEILGLQSVVFAVDAGVVPQGETGGSSPPAQTPARRPFQGASRFTKH